MRSSPPVRLYLRASTAEQDADRAAGDLAAFVADRKLKVVARYRENESGAKLKRPELFRLLDDANPGDVLLVEQVDRLSRLNEDDWKKLKALLDAKGVRVVALDLPTSWKALDGDAADPVTRGLLDAVNSMLLDVLAVVARKDYTDRRRRQAQGIAKAKEAGAYTGRKADTDRHEAIRALIASGKSWSEVARLTKAARSTIARAVQPVEKAGG